MCWNHQSVNILPFGGGKYIYYIIMNIIIIYIYVYIYICIYIYRVYIYILYIVYIYILYIHYIYLYTTYIYIYIHIIYICIYRHIYTMYIYIYRTHKTYACTYRYVIMMFLCHQPSCQHQPIRDGHRDHAAWTPSSRIVSTCLWYVYGGLGSPKWFVYNGTSYENGWFGGTTILGNPHIHIFIVLYLKFTSTGW